MTPSIALASLTALLLSNAASASLAQQPSRPRVRVHGTTTREALLGTSWRPGRPHSGAPPIQPFQNLIALAWHNQPVPGGGTLDPTAVANPATIAGNRRVAFFANVEGLARNQGIFTADAQGLHPIVLGCGGGGGSGNPGNGSGDPSPIGGTFSGFFGGTVFAPAANLAGDLLFVADVDGGSAPRGLFFYRASTLSIHKVAAVGDPSPFGGTLGAVGPGSINALGVAVFLVTGASPNDHQILRWQGGLLTMIARDGDPAPGGGVYQYVGSESFGFADGTSIPIGPLPDINASGQVAFRAIVSGGTVDRGSVLWQGGSSQWHVRAGDPTPAGGTYFDMQAAALNDAGEIAFFADYQPPGGGFSAGWFAGSPGSWRTGLTFFDPVGGGQCFGLAFSRNPMDPLSENGDLLLWTDVQMPGGSMVEHLVIRRANGQLSIAARQGDPTPLGGTVGAIDAWPSLDDVGRGTLDARTPGAPGGVFSAHMLFR